MPIEYKITKSGVGATRHVDLTVVFHTSNIADDDIEAIRREARFLLERRDIGNSIDREISVFVRNGRAVALLHYDDVVNDQDLKKVEADYPGLVEHLAEILEVFDAKAA